MCACLHVSTARDRSITGPATASICLALALLLSHLSTLNLARCGCASRAARYDRALWNAFKSPWQKIFAIQGRGPFYDQTGAIRDVMQNHLFQILANLMMEPPIRTDSESIRDEKVKNHVQWI
jgi:hypothetical protein